MLVTLSLQNFAIVDRMVVNLRPGLTVLTGETGAGKSILVDALALVMGGRASTDMIRTGFEDAIIEASFDIAQIEGAQRALRDMGGLEDSTLVVRRVLSRSGRNRVYINGQMATLTMLQAVCSRVIDISGQHEHHRLSQPETHLEILDALGGHGPLVQEVGEAYGLLSEVRAERTKLAQRAQERSGRQDFLQYRIQEIDALSPQAGEIEALEQERSQLRHAEALKAGATVCEDRLYGREGSAVELIGQSVQELEGLVEFDPSLKEAWGLLQGVQAQVEDLGRFLASYADRVTLDEERLEGVEDRLQELRKLARKHGSLEGALAAREEMARELMELAGFEERAGGLEAREGERAAALLEVAGRLSAARKGAGARLAEMVTGELRELSMPGSCLVVDLQPLGPGEGEEALGRPVGLHGMERVRFLIVTNEGEEAKALNRIASGGELARVHLAMKTILTSTDPVGVYVFDEVDQGIGGATAEVVGRKIRTVADEEHQVLTVTHLPQIAALADHHIKVVKAEVDGRVVSRVAVLDERERVAELARMLAGLEVTDRAMRHAKEMRTRGKEFARVARKVHH